MKLKALPCALLAILAFSAVAVASASAAAPEYVLKSGTFPVKFTSTSGAGVLETTTHETVNCTSDTNVGELTSAKKGTVTVTFKGCTTTFFGFPIACQSGSTSGVIVTKLLSSELEYNVGKTKVLNLLSPASGTIAAEFKCAGNTVTVFNSVLGEFPTTNTFLHSTSLALKQTGGMQEFESYVNAAGTTVTGVHLNTSKNGEPTVPSAEETTDTITLEGTRELKITK